MFGKIVEKRKAKIKEKERIQKINDDLLYAWRELGKLMQTINNNEQTERTFYESEYLGKFVKRIGE